MPAPGKRDSARSTDSRTQLADDLFAVLPRLRMAVLRNTRRHFPHPPLPEAQANLLRTVAASPGLTVREAARTLQLAANTVSTLVAALGAEDLLERRTCPKDRRSARLHPTELALGRLAEFDGHRRRVVAAAMSRMSAAELDTLQDSLPALGRLIAELDDQEE
ncbi:MarR family winged helix-turn-helix transcriptional regulator [Crossiella sp. CA198]|uniref:MarR family winged helix-turn-helix transcriptional regulator n=1 Tax=Crossiella sp. CA198 TaxID=3455607 RepID=UPI003F8D404F